MLSCNHVMKGAEGNANVPIVQPSLLDTVRKMKRELQTIITACRESKRSPKHLKKDLAVVENCLENQSTKEEVYNEFVKCCQKIDNDFAAKCTTGARYCCCEKCTVELCKAKFLKIYEEEPRKIATYTDGVKSNIEGMDEEEGPFYVDAAIAKLENSELQELEENERVQLADTSKTKNKMGGRYPLKMTNLDCTIKIFKCGRTTKTTYGYLESRVDLKEKRYPMVRDGYNKPRTLLFHVAFPQFYCDTCAQEVGLSHKGDTESPTTEDCTACRQTASCHPYYALSRRFCKSCAEKRGIIWDDVTEDITATCVFCNQMKPCCVDVSLPRYLCGSCSNQAQAAETPEIATFKTCCDECGEPKVCSPYHDEEPGYQSEVSSKIIISVYRSRFNKETIQVYFTSRTLVFTSSHKFGSNKSLYKSPLQASNTRTYNGSRNFTLALCIAEKYTCIFFIELTPGLIGELSVSCSCNKH